VSRDTAAVSADAEWLAEMPAVYHRCLGPALFAPFAAEVAARCAQLRPHRVLELAAGTGIGTRALVQALPHALVTATDLNPAMVEFGGALVPQAGWLAADAQQLALPDGAFDLVTCQFGVMFFPDRLAAFAEVARVLRPGGTAVFTVWDVVGASTFPAAMVAALDRLFGEQAPSFLVRVPHGYADPDRIAADLRDGGLQPQALDRVVLPTRAPSARVLAEGFCLGTPLRFALAERGSPTELLSELGELMVGSLGQGEVHGELTAFVVTARNPA
jgi:SAM-dependent methyltransferase